MLIIPIIHYWYLKYLFLNSFLVKQRIADLFHEHSVIEDRFFISEKEKYLELIEDYFEQTIDEVIKDGNEIHKKTYEYIDKLYKGF